MQIVHARMEHLSDAAELALLLWPAHTFDELANEMCGLINSAQNAVFLAYHEDRAIAFVQCSLRYDYVEGSESSPVGYLEGIFVRDEFRGQGVASALLEHSMNWSREQGCIEFASDCELSNQQSLQFHLHSGFAEANRIICFIRKL